MENIERVEYDPGTLSAPAFLEVYTEDGEVHRFKGKVAKRLKDQYKVGTVYRAPTW